MVGKRQLVTLSAFTLTVLLALLPIAARPVQAQTETVLFNFDGSDGTGPNSGLTPDGKGNFYGTTIIGGAGSAPYGTVFEISPNGSGGWNETVVYTFSFFYPDPVEPLGGVIFDSAGNLYGTLSYEGQHGCGAVFELSPVGTSWAETVLYSFADGMDGCGPSSSLIMDKAGNLYGTTESGGAGGGGTVFELSPSGGAWTERTIYAIPLSGNEGTVAGLTMGATGNIFGAGSQTVFELSPNSAGGWNPTALHTFTGAPGDGSDPTGTPVLDQAGNLYGTTNKGGAKNLGAVYEMSPGENGTWAERILHSFRGGDDGNGPYAGVVLDATANIYGTTLTGGTNHLGIIFELLMPPGAGSYKEKTLWSFNGTDGTGSYGNLIFDRAGNLYGTTAEGGPAWGVGTGYGVVFDLTGLPVATTMSLTSSPNPSTHGRPATFTAIVASRAGAPQDGETVTFKHGTAVLGKGTLSGGSASFTTSALPVGTDPVTAFYLGDSKLSGSTSNTVQQVVVKPAN
jgi:uncharacterized repeat protein (TIGR03803 family)